jgi:hypothetical protein
LEIDGKAFSPFKGPLSWAKDKDASPPPLPHLPGPVEVPPRTSAIKESVYNADTVCPLCKARHPFTDCFKCFDGGCVVTQALMASNNHHPCKPKEIIANASAVNPIMPESR